ncbi:MAG: AAC(3) family N-acetyltransferase [Selenomonadaceae bacterium]|nr:AAC(3) family N-acetyltransferase [Selenomonadaceae bacterium]
MNIYNKFVQCFDIKKNDNLWISSELFKFALVCKKEEIEFDGNKLIDAFQSKIGENGTILIPTFNFDFSNKGYYDIRKSKSQVGILGNIALARDDFKRTKHPMHSFAVWGKYKNVLTEMENKHAFGIDSPFSFCVGHKVKQIIIGTDYNHALTFMHYVETLCDVPYRFPKSFTGTYVDENGNSTERSYDYAARYLEIEPREISNTIGKEFELQGISKKVVFKEIENYIIELDKSLPILCDDIVNNQCRGIYEFNIPREEIFERRWKM